MDEHTLLVTGALLHDIGKFVQRANGARESHSLQGEKYIGSKLLGDPLSIIPIFAKFHHKEEIKEFKGDQRLKNLLKIVCEADQLSSMERDEGEVIFGMPLKSIFSSVKLEGKSEPKSLYYSLEELSPKQINFPTDKKELKKNEYELVFREFDNEFTKISLLFNPEKLLMILEKYTSFIPSKMSIENDISLFDHLKSTAAIASCLYYYHKNELDLEPKIDNRTEKKFLFVGGDISGIQDFIYNVSYKGALKYLRARSAFLEFLTFDVALEIVERMNLTVANIIYVGGGNFYLILPNLAETKRILEDVKREINSWLLNNFGGDIFVAIAHIEVDGNSLMKMERDGKSLWDELIAELTKEKQRKFYDVFTENWHLISTENRVCKVCGIRTSDLSEEEFEDVKIEVCRNCKDFLKIGKELLNSEIFIRTKEAKDSTKININLPFSKLYLANRQDIHEFPANSFVFVKNDYTPLRSPHKQMCFLMADYTVKDEKGVKSFDKIVVEAHGAKKIALLKMDVDNLGKIFSEGLKNNSLSRSSTLSRMLNLFFKAHLNTILENRASYLEEVPKISESAKKREVVVIYSGGDDLMLGGTWNDVFESAFEICEIFRKYVGSNPSITISGGYGIFDEKTPIIRMAKIVNERLEVAKDEGRDRIYLMDREVGNFKKMISYQWDEFKRLWMDYSDNILRLGHEFPRSLIYKLMEARKAYLQDERSIYWFINPIYHLSRRRGEEKVIFSRLFVLDPNKLREGKPQEIFFIDVPLKFVDLALREVSS
ncbi:MAG: type III-A CRISPR-associated protein Cas10/Csm1 [Archaeoglobaceae archaeon]